MDISVIIFWVVIIGLGIYIASIYNRLVQLKNRYANLFAQIDVQLKRRYDLIPNLVETAKGYLEHEKETLEAVISARNQALSGLEAAKIKPGNAGAMAELSAADNALTHALSKFSVVVEDYPQLKANENMMQLTEELTSTENKVAFARQAFNDSVMSYNTYKQSFPNVLFASWFGHNANAQLLEFSDKKEIQSAPKVSF